MTFACAIACGGLAIGRVMSKIVGKDSLLVDLQVWGRRIDRRSIAGIHIILARRSLSDRPALPDEILQLLYDWALAC